MCLTKSKIQWAICIFLSTFFVFNISSANYDLVSSADQESIKVYKNWLKRSEEAEKRIKKYVAKKNIDKMSAVDKCEFLKEMAYIPFRSINKSEIKNDKVVFLLVFGDTNQDFKKNITTIKIEYILGVPAIYEIINLGDDSTVKTSNGILTVLNTKSKCGFSIELYSVPDVAAFVLN